MSGPTADEFITIAIPTLNEACYIEETLLSLLAQVVPSQSEILVLDGGSSDCTVDIVTAMMTAHSNLRLVPNPERIQSAAMNLAAQVADPRSTIVVRADAHALYPPHFIETCVAALRRAGAASVVVPMRTLGLKGMQRAIAAAQNSRLGNGASAHRRGSLSGFVDHGHHAAFDRATFLSVGGYNEAFTHNEDAELDRRFHDAGHRVWMEAKAAISYFPRSRLQDLSRQYFRHGRGRARTLLLHRMRPRLRQMAPVLIFSAVVLSFLVAPIFPLALAAPVTYFAICLGWGFIVAFQEHDPWLAGMGLAAIVMHLSWAAGFLRECFSPHPVVGMAIRQRPPLASTSPSVHRA